MLETLIIPYTLTPTLQNGFKYRANASEISNNRKKKVAMCNHLHLNEATGLEDYAKSIL